MLSVEREALLRLDARKISFFERHNMIEAESINSCLRGNSDSPATLMGTGVTLGVGAAAGRIVFTLTQLQNVIGNDETAILCKADGTNDDAVDMCDGLLVLNSGMHW